MLTCVVFSAGVPLQVLTLALTPGRMEATGEAEQEEYDEVQTRLGANVPSLQNLHGRVVAMGHALHELCSLCRRVCASRGCRCMFLKLGRVCR